MSSIICFGEVLWDMLPTGAKPGGAPLNVAVHLKKQGQNPVLVSKIGNDDDGKKLLQFLHQAKIDTSYIQIDEELPTSTVIVHIDKNKNATFEICMPVAWDAITFTDELKQLAKSAELVIFGTLASRHGTTRNNLYRLIENTGAQLLLDVNLRPPYDRQVIVEELLHKANMVKMNDEELVTIAGWNDVSGDDKTLIKHLSEYYGFSLVCVTRGKNGAILYTENTFYEHPGFIVNAIDTVGAGDSFLASLVSGLFSNISPEKALEVACATGLFVASQPGAVPEYTMQDIEKIINSGRSG